MSNVTPITPTTIFQVDDAELIELRRAALNYFPEDRKRASYGLREVAPFDRYPKRIASGTLQALRVAGLLARSGSRRIAAYQLTPLGIIARDALEADHANHAAS